MQYSFEQLLNVRSSYAPSVDVGGDRVYFVSDLGGAPHLWALTLGSTGAWPEPVAVQLDRVQGAHPAPTPGRLVLAADVGGNERSRLYLLDGVGSMPNPLTEAGDSIHTFGGWHPDGRTIAVSSNERDSRFFDVYTLDVETRARRLVYRGDGTHYAAQFSPDGRSLIVQRMDTPSDHTILVLDIETGHATRATPEGRPTRYQHATWSGDGRAIWCVTDRDRDVLALARLDVADGRLTPVVEEDWDVEDFAVSPDGTWLVYEVNHDGYSSIRTRRLTGGSEGDLHLELPHAQAYDGFRWSPTFSWAPDSSWYALTVGTATTAPEVFRAWPDRPRPERLSKSWSAGVEAHDLVLPELVRYPSFDGLEIPAFVFRPRGDSREPGPTLFFVHGGPESQTRVQFNPVIQYLVHRGLTVVAPNVRGSAGYGNRYVHLDDVELRMDSVRDLAAGAEWAARSGLALPERIGVIGGSYGGFMVLAALTSRPDLWAAGVDIVGIANFVTFLEQTGPWRRHLREAEYGSLERDRALLEEISPLAKADRIRAPLMVIHGANDPRVPIGEAEQIVATLRERGRPVEYLRFEDEGHGLAKLRNRLVAYPRIGNFLERHLGAP